jgi:lysozyme family protein
MLAISDSDLIIDRAFELDNTKKENIYKYVPDVRTRDLQLRGMSRTDLLIQGIIHREGGYVNHPADKGGPTNFGITKATLEAYRKRAVTTDDVKHLTVQEATAIYKALYAAPFEFITNQYLNELVVDSGVNHGVTTAKTMLQTALHIEADGIVGAQTRMACQHADVKVLYHDYVAARGRLYGRILTKRPNQYEFAAGWLNRLGEFIERGALVE